MSYIRGTNPDIDIDIVDQDDQPVELPTDGSVYVTVASYGATVTKTGSDVTVEGNNIKCWLTEAESLSLTEGRGTIQVSWVASSGRRDGTDVEPITIGKQTYPTPITGGAT